MPPQNSVRHAGFPSPATDYMGGRIDLNELLIENPSSTFFFRVKGAELSGDYVAPDCLLVVDRAEPVCNNALVVAVVDGEWLVRKYTVLKDKGVALATNPRKGKPAKMIAADNAENVELWGVVIHIIIDPKVVALYDRLG